MFWFTAIYHTEPLQMCLHLLNPVINACRTPAFAEELVVGDGDEALKPPEKSFWAKYVSIIIIIFSWFQLCFVYVIIKVY